jgi:peptidoglycan/LPS O-acetylase OafA/YrhL
LSSATDKIEAKIKLLHIEKLRGISVLLVLFYHLGIPGFSFGYLGVDIFFVVSGYLMNMLYGDIKTKPEAIKFFVRRGARLLPAYFTVLILTMLIGAVLLLPHEVELLMKQGVWSAALLPNFGFWQNAVYFDSLILRPLLNFWSLGVELQFYLAFALLLFVKRVADKWLLIFALLSLFIAAALSVVDPTTGFYLLPSRLWEFFAGYYTYQLVLKKGLSHDYAGLVGLVFLLALLLIMSISNPGNVFIPSIAVVIFSAKAVGLGFSTGSDNNTLSKTLVALGKYSYSIYLVHFPIIVLVNYYPLGGNNLYFESAANLSIILAVTALCAYLLHQLIETKTRHRVTGKQLVFGTVFICALLAVSIKPAVLLSKQKLSPAALALNNGREDRGSFQCDTSFDRRTKDSTSCRLNNIENPSHRLLLFGDSHADIIKTGLLETLNANNQSLRYIKGYTAVYADHDGFNFIEEAIRHNVQTIVIHQMLRKDSGESLKPFAQKAAQSNIDVVFITPVPVYDSSVLQELYENYLATGEVESEGMAAKTHYELNAKLFENIRKYSEELDNFTWYDGSKNLCQNTCAISDEQGKPLYYDSNHLTLTGADYLKDVFLEISKK